MRYNKTNSIHNVKGGMKLLGTLLALLLASSGAVAQSIGGSVYGGGKGTTATVTGAVKVEVEKGTVTHDVYGGGALANVVGGTTVNLKGGTVSGGLYGGGLGDNSTPVTVSNAVQVTVTGGSANNVFGCNNINGAPQSTVQVDIKGGNVNESVFGGGNLATYGTSGNNYPVVNIEGGTVKNVFGGGMGSTDPTKGVVTGNPQVTVKGGTVSQGTYGGGQLAKTVGNPNVEITSGSSAKLFGGGMEASIEGSPVVTVTNGSVTTGVYGGCDNKGNITQAIQVNANGGNIKDVYGGGYGYQTTTGDNVTVTINGSTISGDVYGGSALGQVNDANGETTKVWLKNGTIVGNIYGGGEGQSGTEYVTYGQVNGKVEVLVDGGSVNNVFGCNNLNGSPQNTVQVDIAGGTVNTNVYGGGNYATYSEGSPQVTIRGGVVTKSVFGGGNEAGVGKSDGSTTTQVTVNSGSVGSGNELYGVYGGCNTSGAVSGPIAVNINGGTLGSAGNLLKGIYGGGLGESTSTKGNVTVTIGDVAGSKTPNIYSDIYGGSALGSVNTGSSNTTQIDFLNGTLHGNIYGGGLGQAGDGNVAKGKVNGKVVVNISNATQTEAQCKIDLRGCSVYGCNNTNGSPQDIVTVNVYQTAHNYTDYPTGNNYSAQEGTLYSIDQVFGGGRNANYTAANKEASVNIINCGNTIRRVFGGGDAASATGVVTSINGGRFDYVFGGGNGESSPADIGGGGVTLGIHGGTIGHLFGGSNTQGDIGGPTNVVVDNTGGCDEYITEFFGGGNEVPITGDVNTVIGCGTHFGDVYGGSNKADITGNVKLNVKGGTFRNIFGGSKGDLSSLGIGHTNIAADIDGNVTLNLFGGTVEKKNNEGGNVFGGSNYNGNITGKITVNVLDTTDCQAFTAVNLYGAGNLTAYTPTNANILSPEVNVMYLQSNKSITGNVFGGGLGASATVTANPKVTIGYDAATMSSMLPALVGATYSMPDVLHATIDGNVYGGGDLAPVVGNTSITIQQANTEVGLDVYGGGNQANVSGSVVVNLKGGTVTQDIYGGGALADVNVTNNALTTGATTTVNLTGGVVRNVYGGGLGQISPSSIAAKVYGPVQVNAIGGSMETVFGCNNLNGAPQSTVQVTVEKSTATGAPELAIANVYGGGNQAAYSGSPVVKIKNGTVSGNVFGGGLGAPATVTGNPQVTLGDLASGHENYAVKVIGSTFGGGNAAKVNGVPEVLVQKCNTQAGLVYGGGNAADVYATNITVTGGNTIGEVYGGCYGADVTGNVASSIDGNTNVWIKGGTIDQVYGGNNQSGEIVGIITVHVDKEPGACDMHINEVYGGGNHADSKSNIDQILVSCTGGEGEGINYVYGGANAAKVTGDITLNITDGRIANVFGGNNTSNTIDGKIVVNINKKADPCGWNIGNVYGGGNQATYGTAGNNYPQVNILNGTVSGDVFGGGLGDANDATKGVVTGNPQVTINGAGAAVSGGVYGGGSLAPTNGNAVVTLTNGALTNVYGGGKAANVNGAPTVYINGGTVSKGVFGGCNTSGTVSDAINVYVNGGTVGTSGTAAYGVFGGGFGAGTQTGSNVTVTIGNETSLTPSIYGPVYGGSAKGHVNDAATEITKLWLKKGSITGDIYGGGFGDGGENAKVNGKVQVVVDGGSVTGAVYGCNNEAGAPQSTVDVDVYTTTGIGEVFGGGNQAAYTGTPVVKIHNNNTIGNVYGGGNAASVAGTDVTVYGGSITNVYGGCYGANVTTSGTDVKIYGGTIGKVFGANNSTGGVTGDIKVGINKTGDTDPQGSSDPYDMHIAEVYGGGNLAGSHAGTITVGCTGTGATEGIGDLYGGANNADISSDILVNITEGSIQNVFGGNNAGGNIDGKITVNINKKDASCVWNIGNVFGGGNLADFTHQANVNIQKGTISGNVYGGGNKANVGSSIVTLTDGTINKGLYGGCNTSGTVAGDITVNVNGGQVGVDASQKADIYGGGFGEATGTGGDVTVNFGTIDDTDTHTDNPLIFGDIYGGSAYGEVNATGKTTTVNILNGVVNGNIYGGGHGRKEATGVSPASATVFGNVIVNVGKRTATDTIGGAYLNNSVIYGCNNVNGSPQEDVEVNIWRNGLCKDPNYNSQQGNDPYYSIDQVFGGGNEADFNKNTHVIVHDCSNSIRRVFGGSNASAAYGVNTTIHGGRYDYVYGGGNGEVTAANIGAGGVHLTITAGIVNQLYGGSNSQGSVSGSLVLNVSGANSSNACREDINDIYCGGNYVDITGNVTTTIDCSEGLNVDNLYGGCDHACVKKDANGNGGNVTLTVKGGTFKNVFGGSKGQRDGYSEGKRRHRDNYSADIEGDITLNIYGGTIENVYGGSNILGKVDGTITVNIIDHGGNCALDLGNVYGGGNMTDYSPNYTPSGGATERITPMVNIMHGTVKGNVYGGAKGSTLFGATITSSPRVVVGYDSSVTPPSSSTVNSANFRATVKGDIYGGGDAAAIDGNTEIQLKDRSKVLGNIYGGGNMGEVTGNTKVIVNGKNQ